LAFSYQVQVINIGVSYPKLAFLFNLNKVIHKKRSLNVENFYKECNYSIAITSKSKRGKVATRQN